MNYCNRRIDAFKRFLLLFPFMICSIWVFLILKMSFIQDNFSQLHKVVSSYCCDSHYFHGFIFTIQYIVEYLLTITLLQCLHFVMDSLLCVTWMNSLMGGKYHIPLKVTIYGSKGCKIYCALCMSNCAIYFAPFTAINSYLQRNMIFATHKWIHSSDT
jgi:hypothetical protein